MDIKEFAARYRISPSWARRLVRAGEIKAEKAGGRYLVAPEEAERWMTEQPSRYWVRNISRPDLPALVLDDDEAFALCLCSEYFGARVVNVRRERWEPRIHRLRELGFTIERGWRRGTYPYYCLKDIVEIETSEGTDRIGPHPDCQDPR